MIFWAQLIHLEEALPVEQSQVMFGLKLIVLAALEHIRFLSAPRLDSATEILS